MFPRKIILNFKQPTCINGELTINHRTDSDSCNYYCCTPRNNTSNKNSISRNRTKTKPKNKQKPSPPPTQKHHQTSSVKKNEKHFQKQSESKIGASKPRTRYQSKTGNIHRRLQQIFQALKVILCFLCFTILKPLLFGYKTIQFLDSNFAGGNISSKTTPNHATSDGRSANDGFHRNCSFYRCKFQYYYRKSVVSETKRFYYNYKCIHKSRNNNNCNNNNIIINNDHNNTIYNSNYTKSSDNINCNKTTYLLCTQKLIKMCKKEISRFKFHFNLKKYYFCLIINKSRFFLLNKLNCNIIIIKVNQIYEMSYSRKVNYSCYNYNYYYLYNNNKQYKFYENVEILSYYQLDSRYILMNESSRRCRLKFIRKKRNSNIIENNSNNNIIMHKLRTNKCITPIRKRLKYSTTLIVLNHNRYITLHKFMSLLYCNTEDIKVSNNKNNINNYNNNKNNELTFCDKLKNTKKFSIINFKAISLINLKNSFIFKMLEFIHGIDNINHNHNNRSRITANRYSKNTINNNNNNNNNNNSNTNNNNIRNTFNKQINNSNNNNTEQPPLQQIPIKVDNYPIIISKFKGKVKSAFAKTKIRNNNTCLHKWKIKNMILLILLNLKISIYYKLKIKTYLSQIKVTIFILNYFVHGRENLIKNTNGMQSTAIKNVYKRSQCKNASDNYNNNKNNSQLFILINYFLAMISTISIIRKGNINSVKMVFTIILVATVPQISESFHHNVKYSMNIIRTKYGPLRGVVIRSNPTVEAFLGVPYASPPVGSLRFMPPVTPSTWKTTRLADRFSPVCPQSVPVPPNGPEALLEIPRGRLAELRRLLPLLTNQSEDCLYLNLYVPRKTYPSSFFQTSNFKGNDTDDRGSTIDKGRNPDNRGGTNVNDHYNSNSQNHDSFGSDKDNNSGASNKINNNSNYRRQEKPLPTLIYIHGESYEWNSGNPYDGSVLAAHGNIIVVTINFRLGILGFLKTGGKGSAQGNFGLMDLVAGLHWLRENLPSFGGDPEKITIMGHGTGASLANILAVSPVANDLIHRAILLSGSALSPWAIQKDPLFVKRRVAEQTGCHGDLLLDDLAPCLRTKPISELLNVKIDSPRFLPGFAPFIDGTVIAHPSNGSPGPLTLPAGSAIASTVGIELADFPTRELIFGVTTVESYLDLSAQDLEFGFNDTRRDRILRTYVRNVYHYHLNEIYAALKNEYTDWEKPIKSPMISRDAALELLSDGHTAAPLIRLGYLHSLRGGKSYFLHFRHQSGERDFPQRGGSVRGEDVPFYLGLPISPLFPYNYTKQDVKISSLLVRYISNFVLTGNPNENPTSVEISQIVHSKSSLLEPSLSLIATSSATSQLPSTQSVLPMSIPHPSSTSSDLSLSSSLTSSASSSSSSLAPSSSAFASPFKFTSDQYVNKQLETFDPPRKSSVAFSSNNNSNRNSNIIEESYLQESSMRASLKSKLKRHATMSYHSKRNANMKKYQTRKHFDNNKTFLTKRFTNLRNGHVLRDFSSLVNRQGYSDTTSKSHFPNSLRASNGNSNHDISSEDEDDEEYNEEDENSADDVSKEEDDFTSKNYNEKEEEDEETDSTSKDQWEKDEVEIYDRLDDVNINHLPFWDTYDAINQLYLQLGTKVEIRSHYRGHKLSMWLSLIPQLHSPEDLNELPMRHHHFLEENAEFYDGLIRPQIMQRPSFSKPLTTTASPASKKRGSTPPPAVTTECPPNSTVVPTIAATRPQNHQQNGSNSSAVISNIGGNIKGAGVGIVGAGKQDNNNLLRRLTANQYQSYTTALMVTVAVGCFLLLLNILIFVGIYYQREKRANDAKKKEELKEAEKCSSSPSMGKMSPRSISCAVGGEGIISLKNGSRKSSLQSLTNGFGEYSCYDEKIKCEEKHTLADICSVQLPLKEFKISSSPELTSNAGNLRRTINSNKGNIIIYPTSVGTVTVATAPGTTNLHNPSSNLRSHLLEQETFLIDTNKPVTYHQFQKQHQQQQFMNTSNIEQCNQSTQSDQPDVQDVGTNIDVNISPPHSSRSNLKSCIITSTTTNINSGNNAGTSCSSSSNTSSSNNNNNNNSNSREHHQNILSPGIPQPPPPPKSTAPYQGGILRQPGPPTTPASNKKRVQIQEISV